MINPKAIDDFLARKLDSYDWLKKEQKQEIISSVNSLEPKPKLGKLWLHQYICFLLIIELKRFMLHIAMGGGKTNISISVLKYRKQRGEKPKAVVFVPYITAVATWIDETKLHAPELKCVPLVGTTKENMERLLTEEGDLFVICYQSAVAMLAEPSKKKTKRKKWTIRPQWVREVFHGFDTIIMDEIHKCKSVQSLTFRMCRAISAQAEYAWGLTGTPFGRDLQDLWPQFYLIDFGETLGETFSFYRSVFFRQEVNYWGGYEYKFKKRLFKKLQSIIKNISIRYSVDEFYEMPPKQYIPRHIKPNEGIKAYANRCLDQIQATLIQGKKGYRAIESEYLKLRQLSSGFMTFKGEDTKDKIQVKFEENPKLEALEELIDAMPSDAKMVVFHHFIPTNFLISERLKALGIKHARIWSGQRDPLGELKKFKEDPQCKILVMNVKSGSSSLNLQNAQYLVFFEQPDSAIDRQQGESRVWRPGQTKRVMIYDFLMSETADAHLHKWNKDGENLLTALLDGRTTLKEKL